MKREKFFPVGYMFIVTGFFSAIIIGFSAMTRERVKANETIAFERAVVSVLPDIYDPEMSNSQVHNIFVEKVELPSQQTGGAYVLEQDGKIAVYAVPMTGQGFWAPISGIIGIASDKQTVTGIAFYEQNETPGLGAEISKPEFRRRFVGKEIADDVPHIKMKRPGEQLAPNQVHAITGATQTSVRVEKIINDSLAKWKEELAGGGEQ